MQFLALVRDTPDSPICLVEIKQRFRFCEFSSPQTPVSESEQNLQKSKLSQVAPSSPV